MVPQVVDWVTAHLRCGSEALSATATHSPSVVVRLQAMHASVHAFAQHTPWAQKPDWHCVATEHFAPLGAVPHKEFSQNLSAAHCVPAAVQLSKQVSTLHTYG